MKTLYLECASGISGDMAVGALLDLGADQAVLERGLKSLGISGYALRFGRVEKSGVSAFEFAIAPGDGEKSPSCRYSGALGILERGSFSQNAKGLAKKIFEIAAKAEAAVCRKNLAEADLQAAGAASSLLKIAATAICLDNLGVGRVICTPLRDGTGTVRCGHGALPVPLPATMEIVRSHGIPLVQAKEESVLVTPVGAAIAAALAEGFEAPWPAKVVAVGYGAAKSNLPHTANLLRASLLEEAAKKADEVLKLECNLDDMPGEQLAYACEKVLAAGALDVWWAPVTMKKGRPAQLLSVLCAPEQEHAMSALLFQHTATLGIRVERLARHVMARRFYKVETEYGSVAIKEAEWNGICKTSVEYESAKKLAEEKNIPINQIFRAAYAVLGK